MTKLIFMGTPNFSATVLKGLLSDDRYEIVAVVTQPDRAVGRKKVIQETPVKQAAKEAGLPIYQPEKLSGSPEMEAIMNLGADGIVTAAFGQFLPSILLDSMNFAVNVHASLLPKHRGGAPIHYALIQGDDNAAINLSEKCVKGITVNREICERYVFNSIGLVRSQPTTHSMILKR